LRGTTAPRRSECGLELDRETFRQSAIAWAYRKKLGRLSAFMRTVWQFTFDVNAIRYDAAKPQSARDAAVFRRWVGGLLGACLAVVVGLIYGKRGIEKLAVEPGTIFGPMFGGRGTIAGWAQDAVVPWSAGITLPFALFVYAALLAAYLVSAPGAVLRSKSHSPEQAESIRAIGRYVAAPLAWLVLAMVLFLAWLLPTTEPNAPLYLVLTGLWVLLGAASFGLTVFRTGQWRARASHGGHPTAFLGMGELLLRWALGSAVIVFMIPWCVGLLWIQLDAFFFG
jgi:hypothetical protein